MSDEPSDRKRPTRPERPVRSISSRSEEFEQVEKLLTCQTILGCPIVIDWQ
jgi:hypothetical protein